MSLDGAAAMLDKVAAISRLSLLITRVFEHNHYIFTARYRQMA